MLPWGRPPVQAGPCLCLAGSHIHEGRTWTRSEHTAGKESGSGGREAICPAVFWQHETLRQRMRGAEVRRPGAAAELCAFRRSPSSWGTHGPRSHACCSQPDGDNCTELGIVEMGAAPKGSIHGPLENNPRREVVGAAGGAQSTGSNPYMFWQLRCLSEVTAGVQSHMNGPSRELRALRPRRTPRCSSYLVKRRTRSSRSRTQTMGPSPPVLPPPWVSRVLPGWVYNPFCDDFRVWCAVELRIHLLQAGVRFFQRYLSIRLSSAP